MRSVVELAFFTQDVAALAGFYEELLGGPPAFQSEEMALFQTDGLQLLIHHAAPSSAGYELGEAGPPNEDHFAIGVKDLDGFWEGAGIRQAGGAIGPKSYPWGRSAYTRDPDGRLVELQNR